VYFLQYVKINLLVKGRILTVLRTGCLGEYLHLRGILVDISRNIIKVFISVINQLDAQSFVLQ